MGRTLEVIRLATEKGYHVSDEGVLYGPRGGVVSIKLYGNQKYPSFSVNTKEGIYGVPLHQFAAYQFFGKCGEGRVVRHLDGDTLNCAKGNLRYGTHSENNLDKPKGVRINAAKKGRASQPDGMNCKIDEFNRYVLGWIYSCKEFKDRAPDGAATWLGDWYGVGRGTITTNGRKYATLLKGE